VDSNVDGGSIGLLTLDPLDVDSQLSPVALDNLADLENISLKIQRAASKYDIVEKTQKHVHVKKYLFFSYSCIISLIIMMPVHHTRMYLLLF
jgi:hypothetical protein